MGRPKKRKVDPILWQQLRDIFAELNDDKAMFVFKELMQHNLVDEATTYMIAIAKEKLNI